VCPFNLLVELVIAESGKACVYEHHESEGKPYRTNEEELSMQSR